MLDRALRRKGRAVSACRDRRDEAHEAGVDAADQGPAGRLLPQIILKRAGLPAEHRAGMVDKAAQAAVTMRLLHLGWCDDLSDIAYERCLLCRDIRRHVQRLPAVAQQLRRMGRGRIDPPDRQAHRNRRPDDLCGASTTGGRLPIPDRDQQIAVAEHKPSHGFVAFLAPIGRRTVDGKNAMAAWPVTCLV